MVLTIKQLLNYSWMSQASYLDFTELAQNNPTGLEAKLINSPINKGDIFTAIQAQIFTGSATSADPTDGFSFVSYAPNYQDTGFSATVFKSNADSSFTIAVRGTEPEFSLSGDLFRADALGVVLQGAALEQLFVGYRYYKQLTSTGHSSYSQQELTAMASLLVTAHDKNFSNALFFVSPIASLISSWASSLTFADRVQSMVAVIQPILSNDAGLGLISANGTINFTGHSLGGHVAALLAEMVAKYGNSTIGDIATYNAPGINALSYEIQNWFETGTATTQSGVLAKRVAIVADAGPDVTSLLGQTNGAVQRTFIEGSPNPIDDHSIVKLSDSLAIYNLMSTLDPTLNQNQAQIKTYLEEATNEDPKSLEKTLDALRQMILGGNITPTLITGASGTGNRDSFYTNLKLLTDSTTFQALIGQVTITAPPTTGTDARTDFSAFLSLFYLTPFSLKTNNAAANNLLLAANSALGDQWTDDYNLNSEDLQNGKANFSDQYLTDRAQMLSWMLKVNKDDIANDNPLGYQSGTQG